MQNDTSMIRHLPWVLVIGALAAGLGNIITTALAGDVTFIADTISDAAAGPYAWIQDFGFYLLAAGLIAQGYVMWHELEGWKTWTLCCIAFTLMAISLVAIAGVHEYGDGDEQGAIVHYWAVYVHGVSFLALVLLSTPRLASADGWWVPLNIAVAALWLGGSIYFFNMGTQVDGLVERGLALLQGAWLILFATRTAWQMGSRPFSGDRLPHIVTAADST